MILRNYQEKLINSARHSFATHKRPLCVLPCGGGKTVCFADMAYRHVNKSQYNYVWFLVHRQELIDQTLAVINHSQIMVAMVQTVSRDATRYKRPTMIIFDEAHHATATTWGRIVDAFPDVPMIGLTATPCRLDGTGLGSVFDCLVEGVGAEWLIENKYLAPYDYYAPRIFADMVPTDKGADYDQQAVAEWYEKRKIWGEVSQYIDKTRKTIVYCPSVAFSKRLAVEIGGTHFDGDTPNNERKKIVEDFRNGKIRVLCNVDLIGEGFDVPDCDCVMLLRPTKSLGLYIQQSMRCLRYTANKRAIIYDFVGNVYRHGMPTDKQEWSLDGKIRCKNPNAEPDITARQCEDCYRVYKGISRFCPYCGHDNGKTQKEIEQDKEAELVAIKKVEKREQGMAQSINELVAIGRKRGYKNPYYWAKQVMLGRRRSV